MQPALDGAATHAEGFGDVLPGSAPMGQADGIQSVAEFPVSGRVKETLQPLSLGFAQLYANHGEGVSFRGNVLLILRDQTISPGTCMSDVRQVNRGREQPCLVGAGLPKVLLNASEYLTGLLLK